MVEISVIMPVYNCEDFLGQSVESILNQTFEDFELICVDDGSTDDSLSILRDFEAKDSRVKVYSQENKGGGIARNFALTKASGRYINFMDADDILAKDALKETYELIEEKKVDFVFFKAINYNDVEDEYFETDYFNMTKLYDMVGEEVFSYRDLGDSLFVVSVTPWGKLYSHDLIKRTKAQFAHGMFHDNKFFWQVFLNSERMLFYNKCLYVRRIHPSSLQSSHDKKILYIFDAYDAIFSIFRDNGQYERYKSQLYSLKCEEYYNKFFIISDDLKPEFLKKVKDDLTAMVEYDGEKEFAANLRGRYVQICKDVMECSTDFEFELLAEKYMLDSHISELKNEVSNLKKENDALKRKNSEILNSRSWKITEPLRKMRHSR